MQPWILGADGLMKCEGLFIPFVVPGVKDYNLDTMIDPVEVSLPVDCFNRTYINRINPGELTKDAETKFNEGITYNTRSFIKKGSMPSANFYAIVSVEAFDQTDSGQILDLKDEKVLGLVSLKNNKLYFKN